jgi:hypothetical protein
MLATYIIQVILMLQTVIISLFEMSTFLIVYFCPMNTLHKDVCWAVTLSGLKWSPSYQFTAQHCHFHVLQVSFPLLVWVAYFLEKMLMIKLKLELVLFSFIHPSYIMDHQECVE